MKNRTYNFRFFKKLLAAITILGLTQTASAFTWRGLKYEVLSEKDKTVTVASQDKSTSLSGIIVIPDSLEYNGSQYIVTEITGDAFIECRNITEIVVPATVTTIGNGSFAFCSSLETLDIGKSVKSIGADFFTGLSSLKSVISRNPNPPSITDWGEVTTDATLYVPIWAVETYRKANIWEFFTNIEGFPENKGFKSIRTLTVGNLVEEIKDGMFASCDALETVTLGSGIKKIGDEAFSDCISLEEIIVPPSVETIGASAFAGNSKLATIIMGHRVKTIGEKAFDGCPASTVSITAQVPPTAPNNTFSNYTGRLYLQGEAAVDAYYDALYCWDRFNGYVMIEPSELKVEGEKKLTGKPGDTFQLTATLMPENVTLPQIFWRSTNPEIATVDEHGLVTLHADIEEVMAMAATVEEDNSSSCKIIAESLYNDGPVAEFDVTLDSSGVEDIIIDGTTSDEIDFNAPVNVYNLNGMLISNTINNLPAGIYIVRQGNKVRKIALK